MISKETYYRMITYKNITDDIMSTLKVIGVCILIMIWQLPIDAGSGRGRRLWLAAVNEQKGAGDFPVVGLVNSASDLKLDWEKQQQRQKHNYYLLLDVLFVLLVMPGLCGL